VSVGRRALPFPVGTLGEKIPPDEASLRRRCFVSDGLSRRESANRLTAMGFPETGCSVTNKLSRGSFPETFLFGTLKTIEKQNLSLED
jgi:hypothetical protein